MVDGLAVCHVCGEAFGTLNVHVWKAHDLTAAEYKALFGLNRKQGLSGTSTTEKKRDASRRLIAEGRINPNNLVDLRTPEQRVQASAVRRRKQAKNNSRSAETSARPEVREAIRQKAIERMSAPVAKKHQSQAMKDYAVTHRDELVARSKARIKWRDRTCVVCGKTETIPSHGARMTCSKECAQKYKADLMREVARNRSDDAYKKMAASKVKSGKWSKHFPNGLPNPS
jgi:hypothetical protein